MKIFEYISQYVAIIQVILVFKEFLLIYFKWMPQYQTVVFFYAFNCIFCPLPICLFQEHLFNFIHDNSHFFNIIVNDSENLKFIHLKLMYPFK